MGLVAPVRLLVVNKMRVRPKFVAFYFAMSANCSNFAGSYVTKRHETRDKKNHHGLGPSLLRPARATFRLEARSIHLAPHSLRRLWKWVSAAKPEKPSQRTLDRLALFAGFQDWKDLQKALHGTNDAALNYKD